MRRDPRSGEVGVLLSKRSKDRINARIRELTPRKWGRRLADCIRWLNAYLIGWLGQRVIFDMRFQSYRHLQRLSLAYYDGKQPGKIMSRLTSDIDVIQYALTSGFVSFLTDLATVVIAVTWLFLLDTHTPKSDSHSHGSQHHEPPE